MPTLATVLVEPITIKYVFLIDLILSCGLVEKNLMGSLGYYKDLPWPSHESEVFLTLH